jgi:hypothetical protein
MKGYKQDSQKGSGHLYLMEVNLSFDNSYVIKELLIPIMNISSKPCHCRNTNCWTYDMVGD